MLKAFHQSSEETDVLGLGRAKLVVVPRWYRYRSTVRRRRLLLELGRMLLLLLLHISQRCRDGSLQVRILFLLILSTVGRFRLDLRLGDIACCGVCLDLLQTHFQCSLEICVEAVLYPCAPGLERALIQRLGRLCSVKASRHGGSPVLVRKFGVASIIHAHGLHYSKVGKSKVLAGAGATEDASAVAAVVLSVGKGKGGAASQADVGISPLGGLPRVSLVGASRMENRHLTALLSNILLSTSWRGGKWKPSRCSDL